ncbi:MAG: sensor domain-containing diguanylate cyclase [Magnetospirillum sp.]|nr:MAG: sensor domain-containing diguanylate cyclase [Magnetospirillum sp.]
MGGLWIRWRGSCGSSPRCCAIGVGGRQASRGRRGSQFPIEVTVAVGEARVGGKRLHVGIVRDIAERKAYERRLTELATIDGLTGALNRRAFLEVLAVIRPRFR